MSVGACNLGRGTARLVAEQSKLTEKDEKDKKAKRKHQSETPKPDKDEFSAKTASNGIPAQANTIPASTTANTPVLNKLV